MTERPADRARGERVVRRALRALRHLRVLRVFRVLRDDLWTTAAEPPPHTARPRWLDWLPAIAVVVVVLAGLLLAGSANEYAFDYHMGTRPGLLLAALQSAALVAALFRPVPAWWGATLVMPVVAWYARGEADVDALYPWTGTGLTAQAGVLFLLALRVRPRITLETLLISAATGLGCGLLQAGRPGGHFAVTVLAVAALAGAALRGRQVARTELAAQQELTAEERTRRTVLQERTRIARELHDVVAHHMSVVSIQAQVAPHLVDRPSPELTENLAGIRANAVDALAELRRVLGLLRAEDTAGGAPDDGTRHAPQPGLDLLDELLGKVRGTGLAVTAVTTGERRPLPPGVELSAYRIVQESLSNVLRHAPGARARVELGYHPSGLTVRVRNTRPEGAVPAAGAPGSRTASGAGSRTGSRTASPPGSRTASPPDTGHGLLGMRERTAMLGGELATGPTPDGGWEVTAVLPTTPPAEDAA